MASEMSAQTDGKQLINVVVCVAGIYAKFYSSSWNAHWKLEQEVRVNLRQKGSVYARLQKSSL